MKTESPFRHVLSIAVLLGAFLLTQVSVRASYSLQDFLDPPEALKLEADRMTATLSESALAGQLIVIGVDEAKTTYPEALELAKAGKIGGATFFSGEKADHQRNAAALQKTVTEAGHLPLIFSIDAEPTLVNGRLEGLPPVKQTNAITDVVDSWIVAAAIAQQLKALGFQQNFAPVVDVAKASEFMASRSFGTDSMRVIELSCAFIQGTQENGIVATAKHFPGHGYVAGDTHKGSIFIDGELQELSTYPPLIETGVISIMIGHMTVRHNERWSTDDLPASCSRAIVTDLLKGELGFKGLVITDALDMKAVTQMGPTKWKPSSLTRICMHRSRPWRLRAPAFSNRMSLEETGLLAAQAGNDQLLAPKDPAALHRTLVEAMEADPLFRAQVVTSVSKIIRLKLCLGLLEAV